MIQLLNFVPRLTNLTLVTALIAASPSGLMAEDSDSTGESRARSFLNNAKALHDHAELSTQLEEQAAKGDFYRALRTSEKMFGLTSELQSLEPAALSEDADQVVDLMIAREDLEGAAAFCSRVATQLKRLDASDEMIRANDQTRQAMQQFRARLNTKGKTDIHRYMAVLRSVLMEVNAPVNDSQEDVNAINASPTTREELFALEEKLLPAGHLFSIQSLVSIGIEAARAGDSAAAEERLGQLENLDRTRYPHLLLGHAEWLRSEIAVANEDYEAASQSALKSIEHYGENWPLDAAAVASTMGYELQLAERYEQAADFQRAAADIYIHYGQIHNAINEADWLVTILRMIEKYEEASQTLLDAKRLSEVLRATATLGNLYLEEAWIAEARGQFDLMQSAYNESIASYLQANQPQDAINVAQHMADSFEALVDNQNALVAYEKLIEMANAHGLTEQAGDAVVAAAGRQRRLSGRDDQLALLGKYRDQMRDAPSMRIVIDEIARLQAGMDPSFTQARKRTRELAKRIASGEDSEKVLAELDQVLEEQVDEDESIGEAEAFLEEAATHLQANEFEEAAQSFLNAARWFNDLEDSSEQLRDTMSKRADALRQANFSQEAKRADRIASDHTVPSPR